MKHAQPQALKENADGVDRFAANINATARALADDAQSTAEKVGAQLSGWTEEHGHKVAALWSMGGGRLRRVVFSKPFLNVALIAGAGALAYYLLKKRYGTQNVASQQTASPVLTQDAPTQPITTPATTKQPGIN